MDQGILTPFFSAFGTEEEGTYSRERRVKRSREQRIGSRKHTVGSKGRKGGVGNRGSGVGNISWGIKIREDEVGNVESDV